MMRVSVNLLPPEKKRALQTGFIIAFAQTMALIFFIIAVFVAGMFLSVRILLKSNYDALAAQSSAGGDESDTVATEIRDINAYLKRLESIQKRFVPWSDVLVSITAAVPNGVILEDIELVKNKIKIRGITATRDDVIALRENLIKLPFLTDVSNPLSNLLQKKDVKFEFEMNYAPQK